jgi:hypothetical protein
MKPTWLGSDPAPKKVLMNSCLVLIGLLVCLTPMIFPQFFYPNASGYPFAFKIALLMVPVSLVYMSYRLNAGISGSRNIMIILLLAAVSALLVDVHRMYIDVPSNVSCQYWQDATNDEWQHLIHERILALDPNAIPHVYRFLPDSMVELFRYLTDDYSFARLLYRETFMFLFLYAVYYYARLFSRHEAALLTVLLYAVVYHISIRYYAGQLSDPLSHLTFVLSFIFLELDLFAYFALSVLIGLLAKESILVMAAYYLLVHRHHRNGLLKGVAFLAVGTGLVAGIRLYVVPGFEYKDISGAGTVGFVIDNLRYYQKWINQIFFTVGIFVPFVVLSWRKSAVPVRRLVVFLLPVLLLSNAVFSWFGETRNLIPAVIPMALMTAGYLMAGNGSGGDGEPPCAGTAR